MPLFRTGASTYCIQFQAGEISSGNLRDVAAWNGGFKDASPELYSRPDTPFGHGGHTFWFGQPWPTTPFVNDILRGISPLTSAGDEWRAFQMGPLDLATDGPISGDASITEADDTPSATAALTIAGSLASAEGNDALSATSALAIDGSLTKAEADDITTAIGAIAIAASLSANEALDVLSADGTVGTTGSLVSVEGNDTTSAQGALAIGGATVATEVADTVSATGAQVITATSSPIEANDTLVSVAQTKFAGGAVGPVPLTAAFDNTRIVHWAPVELYANPAFDFVFETPRRSPEKPVQTRPAAPVLSKVLAPEPPPAQAQPPPDPISVGWHPVAAAAVLELDRVLVDMRPVAAARRKRIAAAAEAAQAHDREIVRQWLEKRGVKLWA